MLRTVLAISVLGAIALLRLGRAAFGAWALWVIAGPAWAVLAALALLLRFTLPVRAGIFIGACWLLHWPWLAGALLAAPRPFLMIPGLASTLIARARHPRPLWQQQPATGT